MVTMGPNYVALLFLFAFNQLPGHPESLDYLKRAASNMQEALLLSERAENDFVRRRLLYSLCCGG